MSPETIRNIVMGGVAIAAALVVALALGIVTPPGRGGGGSRPGVTAAGKAALDDQLIDLQLVPLEARTPPAFTLDAHEGGRVSLADFTGRPVMIYFWASW
jgi:cytochrome oxidase Cu insertion factor (SCO1/SenC/PrrC family)